MQWYISNLWYFVFNFVFSFPTDSGCLKPVATLGPKAEGRVEADREVTRQKEQELKMDATFQ
jgi:hypothetical protein